MQNWTANSYGDEWATEYDSRFSFLTQETALVVEAISDLLVHGGSVLELGVGTGRIAIPLAQRGVRVVGLDASQRMLEILHGKAGSDLFKTAQGDFSDFDLDEEFAIIFMSCNTLFSLPSQDLQLACLNSAAKHLTAAGIVIVEAGMPSVLINAPSVQLAELGLEASTVELISHDAATQQVHRQRVSFTKDGLRLKSIFSRYIWPSELELMARLAGMELRFRWSGWEKGVFGSHSTGHISAFGLSGSSGVYDA